MVLLWALVLLALAATIVAVVPSLGHRMLRGQWLELRYHPRAFWAVNGGAGVALGCAVVLLALVYSGA